MAKAFTCQQCRKIKVVIAEPGTMIQKGAGIYCEDCNNTIQACLRLIGKENVQKSPMNDLFGDMFKDLGKGGFNFGK